VNLLDTNVISEPIRREPDSTLVAFLRRQRPQTLFTAAICEAELRYGLARMPTGRWRNDLAGRVTVFLATAFAGRIMAFDTEAAALYSTIRAAREAAGRPIAMQNTMIAATARAYGLDVATRDADDFVGCGARIVDPWSAE
jgi:toxin FitB